MTDEEFLRALESGTLAEAEFNHAGHVRAGYLYLRQTDWFGALDRVRRAIRNFADRHGKPDRYHETKTVAYLSLIQQHICERGDGGGWVAFAQANSELFDPGLLGQYYDLEILASEMARRSLFVAAAGYSHPHSFLRLPNGHVLASFQHMQHAGSEMPMGGSGGLVEIDNSGRVIRSASSADPRFPGVLRPGVSSDLSAVNYFLAGTCGVGVGGPSEFQASRT